MQYELNKLGILQLINNLEMKISLDELCSEYASRYIQG